MTTAFELNDDKVIVIEKNSELLRGATFANHNRHHYGYHYPRSKETALQCLESRNEFEAVYGKACFRDFVNYYCIGRENTKTSPEEYISFCKSINLEYEIVDPPTNLINKNKIDLCIKAFEPVYSFSTLQDIVLDKLKMKKNIDVRLNQEVIGGKILENGKKRVLVSDEFGKDYEIEVDVIINATYSFYNNFCSMFNFKRQNFQYNIQELNVIKLPIKKPVGITIQDGPYPSFLPFGDTGLYLLAHVETSQLKREVSTNKTPLSSRTNILESNWENTLKECSKYLPILDKCTYKYSIFVDRVVDACRLKDDSRLTEIRSHGNNIWSIFSAKVITCVSTARTLAKSI